MTETRQIEPAARRLQFYRLAAEHAAQDDPLAFAERALIAERDASPPDDPSRAWGDDELRRIARRTYVTRRRSVEARALARGEVVIDLREAQW